MAGPPLRKPVRYKPIEMAPEVGLEPTTSRLIPTRRDSIIEQMFPDPSRRFHCFNLAFPCHGGGAGGVFLAPNQFPGTVFAGEFATDRVGAVV